MNNFGAFPSMQTFLPVGNMSGDVNSWKAISDNGQTALGIYSDPIVRTPILFGQQPQSAFTPPSGVPEGSLPRSAVLGVSTDAAVVYMSYEASSTIVVRWSQTLGASIVPLTPGSNSPPGEVDQTGNVFATGPQIYLHDAGGAMSVASFLTSRGVDISQWTDLYCREVDRQGLTFAGTGRFEFAPGQFRDDVWRVTIPVPGAAIVGACFGIVSAKRRARVR